MDVGKVEGSTDGSVVGRGLGFCRQKVTPLYQAGLSMTLCVCRGKDLSRYMLICFSPRRGEQTATGRDWRSNFAWALRSETRKGPPRGLRTVRWARMKAATWVTCRCI